MSNPESLTLKVVQKSYPEQFGIESNHHEADGEWSDIYVSFSGYFGKFGPHVFAAAPDLLAIAKEAKALLDRGPDTTEAEREDVWRGLSEAIAKAEGATP